MLRITPTYRGTGALLQGDYYDLDWLYATIHSLATPFENDNTMPQYMALMNFAYEVRHAQQGDREKESMSDAGIYYGFRYSWPQLLITTNLLRATTISYPAASITDLAQVTLLETWVKEALLQFDATGGEALGALVGFGLPIDSPFLTHLCTAVAVSFMSKPATKAHFRALSSMMVDFLSPDGEAYSQIVFQLHEASKRLGCPISKLTQEWPEKVIW